MREVRNLLLLLLFSAAAFVYIGHAVPQIDSRAAPEKVEIGETPAELMAAGRTIFESDRAQCLTCHSIGEDPKARCPNLEEIGSLAAARAGDAGLAGGAEYLVESLYNPNGYIVSGYPANQMNPVHRPPIVLSHDEILAVVAYLNALGGESDAAFVERARAVQQPWRAGERQPAAAADAAAVKLPILPGNVERGRASFFARCARCHRMGDLGEDKAPDLTAIGGAQGAHYILESILEPTAVTVRGYEEVEEPMPADFPDLMTPRELYDLVAFLVAQKGQE